MSCIDHFWNPLNQINSSPINILEDDWYKDLSLYDYHSKCVILYIHSVKSPEMMI